MKETSSTGKRSEKLIRSDNLFPVIGIGASAGGLDAFEDFLRAIPNDSGMAYVLVQHLDPTHNSLLSEILQKFTSIPVQEITDEVKVEPNHIYVMPSNKILEATDGVLLLTSRPKPTKHSRNLPIDLFFTSLAEVHQESAIGVVLSGTASDGTLGLKAIKDSGGITFAQDADSAKYAGMPNSAIQAGVVDFILPPGKIPGKLREVTSILNGESMSDDVSELTDDEVYKQIHALMRVRKGIDFTHYKQTTIHRRILRRVAINKIKNLAAYLAYLRKNTGEQDILFQDFLIPVTSFFRDPESFEDLCDTTFAKIVDDKPNGETIRVWVAGCSTGQEAYSIAICLKELLDKRSDTIHNKNVQIFASDLSEKAINKARTGTYTVAETTGVSASRLKKFFTRNSTGYQVKREIRDMCVFAHHNFLTDPPFSKLDLVSCRNVFIYMDTYLQKKAFATFHYALQKKGYLFLGKSESPSCVPDLFSSHSKNGSIYTPKDTPGRFIQEMTPKSSLNVKQSHSNPIFEKKHIDYEKTADKILLSKFTPAGVVVDENMDIVQYRGRTSTFLEQVSGKPSHNLLLLAKQGLSFELRNLLHKVKKEKATVKKENIPVNINDSLHNIAIEAIPLPDTSEPYYLVLFQNENSSLGKQLTKKEKKGIKKGTNDDKDLRIKQLEKELLQTREDMRSITEEQEAANEELQSANEELQSSSEELQSLNEEMETSKEELQSSNEELIVVNHEMVNLNEQLALEKNYSEAIVENLREPLLVLNKNLRIQSANNAFYKTFKVNKEETKGVLIYELNDQWDIPALRTLLEKIIPEKSYFNDFEVTHSFSSIGKVHLLLNAREVIADNRSEKLILLSIEDVTDQVNAKIKKEEIQERNTKDLEKKIQERTIDLKKANEKLQQNNEELLNINKELEAFTYVASHDLQEPLRKIQAFSGRIFEKENKNLSDKGKTYFALIQDAASRMQNLIEDLLSFSRLSSSEREFSTINLSSVIDDVTYNLKDLIQAKNATIEVGDLCDLDIIVFQFRQLIHNLISNAIKFAKPDVPPHIVINCNRAKGSDLKPDILFPDRMYCHLSVSDNGIGFEEKFSETIFEVFQKLHSKDEYPGTGIGLATVKKIVDNHQGTITATSELNKGTVFDIYIPFQN